MAFGFSNRRLRISGWAMQIAGFSVALIIAASVLHRLFGLATPVALNLFLLSFAGAALSILLAAYALWRVWQGGYRGTGSAIVAICISLGILMWPISLLPLARQLPNLNDVTTDVVTPPQFSQITRLRPPGSNPIAYRGGEFANQQMEAYPDLRTLTVERDAVETVTLVAQALRRLRMNVVREAAPSGRARVGYVEAVDRTLLFGFYDDVVVRVRGDGRGTLVDVRSASRFGSHDLGRNADRVREIMTALVERIQATVPKKRARRSQLEVKRVQRSRKSTRPKRRRN